MTAVQRLSRSRAIPVSFTAEEFMEMVSHPPLADRAGKIELVDGEIVQMAPTNIPHWRVQHDVMLKLQAIFAEASGEWLVGVEPTVRFADRSVRLPDVGVFRSPDLHLPIFTVADLFLSVEVADTSLRFDLGPKRDVYAAAGVPHYWVIDLKARRTIAMAAPDGGSYEASSPYRFGQPIPIPGTDATIVID